jgi:hypothetical protein
MLERALRHESRRRRWRRPGRLSFALHGVRLCFATPQDLDFALAARSTLPLARFVALLGLADGQLEREATSVKLLPSRLWEVHAGRGEFEDCRAFLRHYGIQSISKDQDWRAIFMALAAADDPFESYLHVAIARFIDYLDSRHAAIRLILRQRHACVAPRTMERTFTPAPRRRRVAVDFSA